jgi:hypothetical protein
MFTPQATATGERIRRAYTNAVLAANPSVPSTMVRANKALRLAGMRVRWNIGGGKNYWVV